MILVLPVGMYNLSASNIVCVSVLFAVWTSVGVGCCCIMLCTCCVKASQLAFL